MCGLFHAALDHFCDQISCCTLGRWMVSHVCWSFHEVLTHLSVKHLVTIEAVEWFILLWVHSCCYRFVSCANILLQLEHLNVFICMANQIYTGSVWTYALIAALALDSVNALVISWGAEFQSWTDGYWKEFSLNWVLKLDFNLIFWEPLVCLENSTLSNISSKQ